MKICIACSAGGHLTEMLALVEKLNIDKKKIAFFTYRLPEIRQTLKEYKTYLTIDPHRNFFKYLRVFVESVSFLFRFKPRVIISSGRGFVIPLCVMSKLTGTKLIIIETSARVTEPSITGKILYPFADMFFVQWRPLLKKYGRKAVYGGLLI
jgi:beta-1,4-N-acetylglucosaminyltransferase